MGWQLALQGTTVLAIGGLNKTIKDECESIADELTNLQDINVEGFANVEDAIRSLESSLINGIEELKWQLCSIDNKLGKIGKVDEIKEGTFSIPKSLDITFDERQIEIPARLVMPIGKDKPEIKIR